MTSRHLLRVVVFLLLGWAGAARAEPVTLTAADGTKVYGDAYRSRVAKPPIVVAFHQAESSAAEYAPIAPRLVALGFTVLAIDQRSGGGNFGGTNRTVAALGSSKAYDEALPDLEAALAWAKREAQGAPVVVWGSSYSAALVFLLAAAHPGDVSAVVSLSPGEYLQGDTRVRQAAARVDVPVYIDQATTGEETRPATAIFRAVKSKDKQQTLLAAPATHASSMLRADSNAAGAEAHWQPLLRFLSRFAPKPAN